MSTKRYLAEWLQSIYAVRFCASETSTMKSLWKNIVHLLCIWILIQAHLIIGYSAKMQNDNTDRDFIQNVQKDENVKQYDSYWGVIQTYY